MNKKFRFTTILFISAFILIVICTACPKLIFVDNITSTVTGKDVKRYDNEDKYLIYTKDSNGKTYVFEDTDSIIPLKFNSSDIYAEIEVGHIYEFKVRGLRIKLLSSYQNIYKVTEIKE